MKNIMEYECMYTLYFDTVLQTRIIWLSPFGFTMSLCFRYKLYQLDIFAMVKLGLSPSSIHGLKVNSFNSPYNAVMSNGKFQTI